MKRQLLLVLLACLAPLLAACGSAGDGDASGIKQTIESGDYTVIDVRTPAEFDSGHLRGARNIDVQADFEAAIADLDKSGRYVVYCRSGNRSAQAKQIMEKAGFTDVVNAGGFEDLKALGLATE